LVGRKCVCGNKCFENVDVTPSGAKDKRYFTRCKQCGLVISTYGCGLHSQDRLVFSRLLSAVWQIPIKLYYAVLLAAGWNVVRAQDTEVRG
jgi:hypothetical protein